MSNAHGVPYAIGHSIAERWHVRAFDQGDQVPMAGDGVNFLDYRGCQLHAGQFLHEFLHTTGFGFDEDLGLDHWDLLAIGEL